MVENRPREGFISKAVRGYYKNLKTISWKDQKFKNASEFARRCHDIFLNYDECEVVEPSKNRFRCEGGGRKAQAPEFRDMLFEWFIGKQDFWHIHL